MTNSGASRRRQSAGPAPCDAQQRPTKHRNRPPPRRHGHDHGHRGSSADERLRKVASSPSSGEFFTALRTPPSHVDGQRGIVIEFSHVPRADVDCQIARSRTRWSRDSTRGDHGWAMK